MGKGGHMAIEAAGMAIAALSAQAVIRGLFDPGSEPFWGVFAWVPGGFAGQMVLLGCTALVGTVFGGWAHTRQGPAADRAGDAGGISGRGTA